MRGGRHPLQRREHHVPQLSARVSDQGTRPPAHELTRAVARAVGLGLGTGERSYLALLDRRLVALASVAAAHPATADDLGLAPRDVTLARGFLRPREATWHDGDENLVRGHVEAVGTDSAALQARRLLDTADLLARIAPRIETVWCFLWMMEAALPSLVEPPDAPC